MSYLSLSQLKDVMHAPESCGIYLGRQANRFYVNTTLAAV